MGANAVDGFIVNGLAVGAGLLEADRDAYDHGTDLRLGVEECGVGLERLGLIVLLIVKILDDRKHRDQVTEGLHVLLREAGEVAVVPIAERLGESLLRDLLLSGLDCSVVSH